MNAESLSMEQAQPCPTHLSTLPISALFVLNNLAVGGSETKTVRVANELLRRRNVRTGVAYLNEPCDLSTAFAPEIPLFHLDRRGKISAAAVGGLRSLIQAHKPRVVFAMNLYPTLYVALATIGIGYAVRSTALININEFRPGFGWQTAFYRPILKRFDNIVYGCNLQRENWDSQLRYPKERSRVIYNGVDTDHFRPDGDVARRGAERQRLGIASQAFIVGAVGRLRPEKNHALLIDAIAELRRRSIDAHLLLAGEGPMRGELENRATASGIRAHVTFTGAQRDVRGVLSATDVFVLPSTHVETFSNAALEAMAMGKPVVLSKIGGAAEMIRDTVDGFTLSRDELSRELVPLLVRLQGDGDLRERMGRAARTRVVEEFSLQAMVEDYVSLIDSENGFQNEKGV